MNKTIKTLLFAGMAAVLAGCGNSQKKAGAASEATAATQAIKITTVTATKTEVPQTEVYSSTIQANAVNNIAPQSSARIQKINVEVGDFVSRGQILAEMDRVNLDQARMKMINDSTEYMRLKGLFEEGGVSQSDYEAMELQYSVSKSSYDNLVENTVLRAPISGVITARNYDRGDMYSMGSPIYVLQQITPVKILVGVTESDYTKVKVGQEVSLTVDAFPDRTFKGRVNRLYPVMESASHTFNVEVVVTNSDRVLRPGMYARVTISFGSNLSVTLPDEAVVKQLGSGQRYVYILSGDGTVRSSEVTLGKHDGETYEILSGVEEGDVVAVGGSANLKDGSKVEVIDE